MYIHVNSYDNSMCYVINQFNFISVVTPKPEALWNNDDKKNTLNLINSLNALGNLISNTISTNEVVIYLIRNW